MKFSSSILACSAVCFVIASHEDDWQHSWGLEIPEYLQSRTLWEHSFLATQSGYSAPQSAHAWSSSSYVPLPTGSSSAPESTSVAHSSYSSQPSGYTPLPPSGYMRVPTGQLHTGPAPTGHPVSTSCTYPTGYPVPFHNGTYIAPAGPTAYYSEPSGRSSSHGSAKSHTKSAVSSSSPTVPAYGAAAGFRVQVVGVAVGLCTVAVAFMLL